MKLQEGNVVQRQLDQKFFKITFFGIHNSTLTCIDRNASGRMDKLTFNEKNSVIEESYNIFSEKESKKLLSFGAKKTIELLKINTEEFHKATDIEKEKIIKTAQEKSGIELSIIEKASLKSDYYKEEVAKIKERNDGGFSAMKSVGELMYKMIEKSIDANKDGQILKSFFNDGTEKFQNAILFVNGYKIKIKIINHDITKIDIHNLYCKCGHLFINHSQIDAHHNNCLKCPCKQFEQSRVEVKQTQIDYYLFEVLEKPEPCDYSSNSNVAHLDIHKIKVSGQYDIKKRNDSDLFKIEILS